MGSAPDNFPLLHWISADPAPPPAPLPGEPENEPSSEYSLHARLQASVKVNRVLLLLGTGVTLGLLHRDPPPLDPVIGGVALPNRAQELLDSSWTARHELAKRHASWDGLVSSLAESVKMSAAGQRKDSLNYLMCAVVEIGRAESAVLAGVAHPLQRRLRNGGQWDAQLKSKIRMLEEFLNDTSAWAELFAFIKDLVATPPARPPLIVTTNYDDLIAKLCNLKVLCVKPDTPQVSGRNSLGLFDPAPLASSPPTATSSPTSSSPDHLAKIDKAEDFWTLYEQNLLENGECFVHHLHGWFEEPNSIVLDAADYANRVDTSPDQVLVNWVTGSGNLVIIAGMGAGLLDDHIGRVLSDAASSPSSAAPTFRSRPGTVPPDDLSPRLTFWLVHKDDWDRDLSKVFPDLIGRMRQQYQIAVNSKTAAAVPSDADLAKKAAQLLSVVLVDDFNDMPKIIRAILERTPGSFARHPLATP